MIRLSDRFSVGKLIYFTLPTIIMMIVGSIYSVVDGFFISNFVGKTPFAAINFIMPFTLMLGCTGFLFGTGGGALIAKTAGEGEQEKANEQFSLLVYVAVFCGIILGIVGILSLRWVSCSLGAEGQLLEDSVVYGRVVLLATPFYILQCKFQCLFATAEKPKLGLYVAIASGLTNMVLDYLFIVVFPLGLVGAAAATAIGQMVGGILPVIYFALPNDSFLRIKKPKFDIMVLWKTLTNGSSELMTNISTSVVSMLYNVQLLRYAGEDGVAAYGVVLYVALFFQAVFNGYALGTAPIISYHFGAGNHDELKSLRKKSMMLIIVFAVLMFGAGELLTKPLAMIFVGYEQGLMAITERAFMIYSFSFLFSGFGVWGSSFFTALNDGLVSASIAFLRLFVFQVITVLVFPLFWELDGIWLSIVGAEMMAMVVTVVCIKGNQKKYRY